MAEKPGTESLILASLADHKRSQNHVVLCKQGMYVRSDTMKPKLLIPDFSIDIRIRLAELNFFLLLPIFANFLPCWLAQFC